ncbi:unnamed protein product [Adineta ricciae]|uniref:Phospholipase A2 n=1 Tax=Adineta ricciae TaxID=249248 RepID=A0A815TG75_ADIRI|nr:unnamed protein product [Adineta ricciae]CAF1504869.1 unnamed protein product [Adineta ricciae]
MNRSSNSGSTQSTYDNYFAACKPNKCTFCQPVRKNAQIELDVKESGANVIICTGIPAEEKATGLRQYAVSDIQNRNFVEFGTLILDTIGNPLAYNGYGCWCGKGKRGNLVVDATDRCCQVHDNCFGSAEAAVEKCRPLLKAYKHQKMSNGTIQCVDPAGTCAYRTCQCDKAAVECFLRQREISYNSDFDNWKGSCSETSMKLEDDPQRCPPV